LGLAEHPSHGSHFNSKPFNSVSDRVTDSTFFIRNVSFHPQLGSKRKRSHQEVTWSSERRCIVVIAATFITTAAITTTHAM
jgi:hypothetical protein